MELECKDLTSVKAAATVWILHSLLEFVLGKMGKSGKIRSASVAELMLNCIITMAVILWVWMTARFGRKKND